MQLHSHAVAAYTGAMIRVVSIFVTLGWALWFGGMVFLFVALGSVFTTPGLDRETAGTVAAGLFPKFERMQLAFAAVCLVGTFGWWLASRARVKLVLFTLFGLATVAAVVETMMITPRVERMRVAGLRGTPEFDRMHTVSSRVYSAGAAALLLAGIVLPATVRSDSTARRPAGAAQGFPVEGNGHPETEPPAPSASRATSRA